MQWVLLGVLGFLLFVVILAIVPVYITISYRRNKGVDDLKIRLGVCRFVQFAFPVVVPEVSSDEFPSHIRTVLSGKPPGNKQNESSSAGERWQTISSALHRFQWALSVVYAFLEGSLDVPAPFGMPVLGVVSASAIALTRNCRIFRWETEIGLGDAAMTALATGIMWGMKGSIMAFLAQRIHFHSEPQLKITPNFNQSEFTTYLYCIFKVNVGHIIIVGIRNLAKVGMMKGAKAVGQ